MRKQWDGQPGGFQAARWVLNGDCCAVELGESEAIERLIVGGPLIPQYAYRDGFTEQQGLLSVRAPMHTGHAPTVICPESGPV
jgi:hypothetical protein